VDRALDAAACGHLDRAGLKTVRLSVSNRESVKGLAALRRAFLTREASL
jgi:hypothetical protein